MKYILPVLPLKKSHRITLVVVGIFCVVGGWLTVVPVQAAAGINDTINFQGKLVDDDGLNVTDATYSVVFSLYSVDSGGTAIWTETQNVTTTDGLFQVHLGEITDLPGSVDFNTDNLYLGIKVGADAEMTPRIRFAAVPYAFNAQKVAGLTVTDTTGTLTIPNGKTIQFADAFSTTGAFSLNLTTTGNTSLTLPTTGTLLTNAAGSGQTITSTQASGTVLGITDTTNITGSTTGLSVTLSGTGAFDQTGLSFNLSGATGSNLNDIVGTGNSWKVSKDGNLTVASCTGCGSGSFSGGYFRLADGALSPINDTFDLLVGGAASSSAKFKISPSGTSPTASVSGRTAQASLVVDNQGTGDIFTASASGLNRFVIQSNGNVGVGTVTPNAKLEVAGSLRSSGSNAGLRLQAQDGTDNFYSLYSSAGELAFYGGLNIRAVMTAAGRFGLGTNNTDPQAQFDVQSSLGTLPIASFSGTTARAGLIVDNNGVGDLFTASKSGATKFSVLNNGNLRLNNYLSCTALETDSSGNLTCGTDDTGGGPGGTNYLRINEGTFSLVNDTTDFLFGSNASSSAKFKLSASGTSPTASVSGRTAQAALMVDNQGTGDIFTASASGLNRFVIKSNGNVGIGTTNPDAKLDITGAVTDGALTYKNSQVNFTRTSTTGFSYKDYGSYVTLSDASNGNGTDGDTRDSYGYYATVSHTGTGSNGFTKNIYGGRFAGTATGSIDAASSSTAYGVYAQATGTAVGVGTSQAIGLYASATGGDNNFAAIFANGSVRIDSLTNCSGLSTTAAGVITCGGGGSGTNYLRLNEGTFSLVNDTTDFLFGSNASASAKFKLSARGTQPVASVSGSTSNAAMIVDNAGVGDLFTASRSGKTHFVINNAGNVGIGTSNANGRLVVGANVAMDEDITVRSRNYAGLYLNADTDDDGSEIGQPFLKFSQDNDLNRTFVGMSQTNNFDPLANALTGAFADGFVINTTNTLQLATNNALRMTFDNAGKIGVGTNTPLATFDVRSAVGTQPVASVSGLTSMAALVVNNSGTGDLLTASKSGASKFTVMNNGNVRINNLNASNCDVKSDTTGQLFCGTDSTSGTSKFLVKGTDENVPSGTTMQSDDNFTFAVGASETWIVTFNLLVTNVNSANPDWKAQILGASGWTCNFLMFGEEPANAAFPQAQGTDCDDAPTAMTNATIVADGNIPFQVTIQGRVTTTSAGNITLQWAPNTSGSLTVKAGSYMLAQRVGGSDLAEMYYTKDDSIRPGDVVSMDSSIAAGVKKSTKPYDAEAYGIVSTKPGLLLGDAETNTTDIPVMVALSGRVPVKVSTENGPINAGDLLTTSSTPGVAMKATKAGQVIGQAMTEFGGEGIGEVAAFIKTDYGQGVKLSNLLSTDGSSDLGKAALEHFINEKSQTQSALDVTELLTDRVTAGLELVTPRVIADKVEVNTIKSATGKDISVELSDDGQFVLKNASGEAVIKFDAKGNAFFAGTITAGKFVANSGLDMLEANIAGQEQRIARLEEKLATASATPTVVQSKTSSSSAVASELLETDNLSVAGIATVSANLRVQGNGLIEGILNVVDTLTVTNLIVNTIANFLADAIFHGDVMFKGTAYFNADTAGYATVSKGSDKAEVKFSKPYKEEPVVSATVVTSKFSDETFKKFVDEGLCEKDADKAFCEQKITQETLTEAMPYVIAARSKEGFTILLSQPATQDLTFSWSALAVLQAEEITLKGGDE